MYPVSSKFLSAIRSSHEVVTVARLYADATATTPLETLDVLDGSVRVDTRSGVRRVLTARFASPDGDTGSLLDLLTTTGREVGVWRGIRFPNGRTETAPLGRFRLDTVTDSISEPGAVEVRAPDHAARILDDRFTAPRSATAGIPVTEQIRRLLQESIPGVAVETPASSPDVPSGIVWEEDRWAAVTDLATSIGCVVYADPSGGFVVTPAKTLLDPPDWLIDSGATGVLLGGSRTRSREGVANSVRVSSQPTDGDFPVYAFAEDADPASPTYVGGPFGRVVTYYSSPLIGSESQAAQVARALLGRSVGARASLSVDSIVNPALEGGDRIDVFLPDGGLVQAIADSFEVPLGPESGMAVQTRLASEPAA
jgi:hypothetical protein